MGAFLDKPKTEKHNSRGEGNNLRYGLSSMQGWRVEMEDAHTAVLGLPTPGMTDWSFLPYTMVTLVHGLPTTVLNTSWNI